MSMIVHSTETIVGFLCSVKSVKNMSGLEQIFSMANGNVTSNFENETPVKVIHYRVNLMSKVLPNLCMYS